MKNPDPKSNRSKRRRNRNFVSLAQSTRKHRRAAERLQIACNLAGKYLEPGEQTEVKCGTKSWVHTAGGSVRFH